MSEDALLPASLASPRPRTAFDRIPALNLLIAVIVAAMAFLVLYPIGRLLWTTFVADGTFSLAEVQTTLSDPELKPALFNTAALMLAAGAGALVIGSLLAWLNERTDARMGWAATVMPILPLLVPSVAVSIGWVFLFAPRAGFGNALLANLFARWGMSAAGPVDIYTVAGIAFVTTILSVPFVYLIMAAALGNVDPALEEASRMSGVGPLATFLNVTLPAVRNAMATASVLLVITILAMFAVPAVIGIPARIDVLSVLIFRVLYSVTPPRLGEAVVLSTFMLAAVQLVVLAEYAITRRGHHATVGGRAHGHSVIRLAGWRWPARVVVIVYLVGITVLPLVSLVLVSLQGFWTSHVVWSRLSAFNYSQLFLVPSTFRQAFVDSIGLGVVTATILMLTAALLAFFVQSVPGTVAKVVNLLATLPSSVPHTVVAIGFLVSLGVGQVSLQGTLLLLFLAYMVLFLPVASRAAGTALSQVGRELWESSLMSGATPMRTFVRVLMPLMLSGLLAGWVIVFVNALSEITAGIFLSGTTNPVVGPAILVAWQLDGNFPRLAALTVSITVVQVVVVAAMFSFAGRNLAYKSR